MESNEAIFFRGLMRVTGHRLVVESETYDFPRETRQSLLFEPLVYAAVFRRVLDLTKLRAYWVEGFDQTLLQVLESCLFDSFILKDNVRFRLRPENFEWHVLFMIVLISIRGEVRWLRRVVAGDRSYRLWVLDSERELTEESILFLDHFTTDRCESLE